MTRYIGYGEGTQMEVWACCSRCCKAQKKLDFVRDAERTLHYQYEERYDIA